MMTNRERTVFLLILLIAISFFAAFMLGNEKKNSLFPHIDTEFAKDLEPAEWSDVTINMSKQQVHNLLGDPLDSSYTPRTSARPVNCHYEESYSADGAWIADYAWQSFNVYYDSSMRVIAKDSTWYYN